MLEKEYENMFKIIYVCSKYPHFISKNESRVFDTRLVESVPDHFGQGSRYLGR